MARSDINPPRGKNDSALTVPPSLLDRLIDLQPQQRTDPPTTLAQSSREFRDSVRRDVEWLLNSRFTSPEPEEESVETWRSVYCYGLKDFSAYTFSSGDDRRKLLASIRKTIEIFEPRLKEVEVDFGGAENSTRQSLRFTINAILQMEPSPEHVTFDTVLELSRGEYSVKEA